MESHPSSNQIEMLEKKITNLMDILAKFVKVDWKVLRLSMKLDDNPEARTEFHKLVVLLDSIHLLQSQFDLNKKDEKSIISKAKKNCKSPPRTTNSSMSLRTSNDIKVNGGHEEIVGINDEEVVEQEIDAEHIKEETDTSQVLVIKDPRVTQKGTKRSNDKKRRKKERVTPASVNDESVLASTTATCANQLETDKDVEDIDMSQQNDTKPLAKDPTQSEKRTGCKTCVGCPSKPCLNCQYCVETNCLCLSQSSSGEANAIPTARSGIGAKKKMGQFRRMCEQCGGMYKNLADHIKRHMEKDSNMSFVCDICGKQFQCKDDLRGHKKIHLPNDMKKFKCDYCNKAFPNNNKLRRHLRTHTGEKPYSCDICNKTFSQQHHLEKHRVAHTDEKPWKCPHCGDSFVWKSHCEAHIIQRHTNPNPEHQVFTERVIGAYFECLICLTKCLSKEALFDHKITHFGGLTTQGSVCSHSQNDGDIAALQTDLNVNNKTERAINFMDSILNPQCEQCVNKLCPENMLFVYSNSMCDNPHLVHTNRDLHMTSHTKDL